MTKSKSKEVFKPRTSKNCMARLFNRAKWNNMDPIDLFSQTDEWLLSQPGIGRTCLRVLRASSQPSPGSQSENE